MSDPVTLARTGLLDALEALKAHLDALVVVGAQAIYLHTGAAEVALAEYTTDGDLAVDPDSLGSDPRVEAAMIAAHFEADPRDHAVGTWISPRGVPVDLMVPEAVAGLGSRAASVPPHDRKAMRRARGLEAALVDNTRMMIRALDVSADSREFEVAVAGPAALLVAKLHKIQDRIDQPSRLDNKDAHDIYRVLRSIDTEVLAVATHGLLNARLSRAVTLEALEHLERLFAAGSRAVGSRMAGAAEELVGDPATVSESVALLAQDLRDALNARQHEG
ncbi:hypothetical protein [Demequina sediminis]|uniref:hypothetical protein n=1 Tax=Demequina sediminis TaxID=1930058 RepID=UPI0025741245|nr:hypothetical protein [Demequina sediminis]